MSHQPADRRVTADIQSVDDTACTVLHVDMDAFFAAVELRRAPHLAGQPMMVAGTSGRGVVLSATYQARAYGIRSAMPTAQALARCPGVIVVPPDHAAYSAASRELIALLGSFTPVLEQVSVDEAFLDVAGAVRALGRPATIATEIRRRISAELGLTATIGAASTKFVAKLASSLAKPDGLLIVPPDAVPALLRPLPVRALWGVGPKTAARLQSFGLLTIADIADLGEGPLARIIGDAAARSIIDLAHGRDDRRVTPESEEASIGAERTFDRDITEESVITAALLDLSGKAGFRARRAGFRGRTVVVKIRFEDFTTVTRSETLPGAISADRQIYAAALRCLGRLDRSGRPIRLLGVRLENLRSGSEAAAEQLMFQDGPDDWSAAQRTVDAIAERFGRLAPRPATLLTRQQTDPDRASGPGTGSGTAGGAGTGAGRHGK